MSNIRKQAIITVQGKDVLSEDAELWRYMRLSTLLMLLRGKLYVPTVEVLRRGDPHEANRCCVLTHSGFYNLSSQDEEWLSQHATDGEKKLLLDAQADEHKLAEAFRYIWEREMSLRRMVWCWHESDIESMALWNVYAKEGVAVQSTPARIKRALGFNSVCCGLIGRVHYYSPNHRLDQGLDYCFMRPYFLKQNCYEFEREVRVVLPTNPLDTYSNQLVPINYKKLISAIKLSPHLPSSEAAEVLHSITNAWNAGQKRKESKVPIHLSKSKTVFKSAVKQIIFDEGEGTGTARFGSAELPLIMRADYLEFFKL